MSEKSETRINQFEVVIRPEGGLDEEHAGLLRSRLVNDGFHDHVVSIRPVNAGGNDDDE